MTEEILDVPPKKTKKTTKKPRAPAKVDKPVKTTKKPTAKAIKPPAAKPAKAKKPPAPVEVITEEQAVSVIVEGMDPLLPKVIFEALTQRWAYLELKVLNPKLPVFDPPQLVMPEKLLDSPEFEFVYPIHDHGYLLSTSKGEDFVTSGMSMYKLYLTIEKMIFILIERLKAEGIDDATQVDVAFDGHEWAMRKAFESIIHLQSNVVVANFDPGAWGEGYVQRIQNLIDRGLGAPADAPRDLYRKVAGSISKTSTPPTSS